jgi:hypothetical protein
MTDERPNIRPVCPHGIRWPWQCDDCDEADPMPADYDPKAAA